MAKTSTKILLLLMLIGTLIVTDNAAAAMAQLSPDAEKAIGNINLELQKITDAVVSTAPPGAKQAETRQAALKHVEIIKSALTKAKESGDEKKVLSIFLTMKTATILVAAASPDKKLEVMEDGFNSVAAPTRSDCRTGGADADDKAYCETDAKIQKAVDGVIKAATAPAADDKKMKEVIHEKILVPATATINKAYADGDKKKIAQLLDAYSKAADVVIAATPTDKFNIMDKTFTAITAGASARKD